MYDCLETSSEESEAEETESEAEETEPCQSEKQVFKAKHTKCMTDH